ncbi:MAG: prolyl hydroxylase family protein [Sphingomonadaceae bacterium]
MSNVKAKGRLGSTKLAEQGKSVRRRLKKHDRVEVVTAGGLDLFIVQGFLTAEECDALMLLIDQTAQPSTLYAGTEIEGFRTSYSGNLDPWHPIVGTVETRICRLMGIDKRHGETLQGQRYAVGQQFKPHHDYFFTSQDYWEGERVSGGQRSWTAMIYLNEPEKGGETNFGKVGMCVSPRTAMLVMWNNMDEIGAPNDITQHEGMAVEAGTKYIVTKWFRERFWIGNI